MASRLWFRLLVGTGIVLAVTLAAVVLLVNKAVTGSFQDYVEDQQSVRIQRAERILTRYYERRHEWAGIEATLQSVADLMGDRLVVADAQNQVVADSQGVLAGQTAGKDLQGKRVPIRFQDVAVGTLYINPLAGDQRAVDPRGRLFLATLNEYLTWAVVVGVLAAVGLSLGLARWLASPLEALTRAVRRMERGELEQRIDTSVGGEVGALAEAFNALAASLARVEQLRRMMVSDIAHELRTPLASIRGYLEAIQDGVVAPDQQTLDTIHRELMQLTRLVDDLQELSLAEAHQLTLDRQQVDVRELVEWGVRAFRPQAIAQQVELTLDLGPGVPSSLWLDAGRIDQVFGNVLRNALAHTPAGGRIDVSVTSNTERVLVAIQDSGPGIAPADLQHIFERFYRAEKARSRRAGGTGLGLTIARELLRMHGGSIVAESEVSRGARFVICLPTAAQAPAPATLPIEQAAVGTGTPARPRHPRALELVAYATTLGALFGAAAGLIESWMVSAIARKAQLMDLGGYAVLIDAGVFAALGAIASTSAVALSRMVGRPFCRAQLRTAVVSSGCLLVGLLVAYRWNQLFNPESEPDSPEVLYPTAIIVCSALLLAALASFGAAALRQRWRGARLTTARRALPTSLVAVLLAATVLVGRDQVTSRLAAAPVAGAFGPATSPRSPAARPGPPEWGASAAAPEPPVAPPLAAEPPAPDITPRRPYVQLVTVSGLRADHLGAYGYEKARTPAIDALARSGARFTTALTVQPDTNAAHAAILTGTYPATNGVRTDLVDRLDPSVPTLAQSLADHGYRTAAIYSWVSFEPAYSGLDHGFHDYLDLTINRPEYLSDNRAQVLAATYQRLKAYLAVPRAVPEQVDGAFGAMVVDDALDGKADVTTEAAIAWVEENKGSPFFLWVHYFDPHYPYSPPPPFDDVSEIGCVDACPDGTLRTIRDIQGGAQLTASQINHLVGLYDGEVAFTDQQIGRLLQRLGELGLAQDTMVVLTSDHGQSFDEHDRWFSGEGLYNAEARVPLIMAMPGRIVPGTVIGVPTLGIDLAPTVLDVAGAARPNRFEGQSLLPLMDGGGGHGPVISALADRSVMAVADRGWKLIWSADDQSSRLYFLPDDPNELNDRAEDHPDLTAQLLATLQDWQAAHPN